MKRLLLFLISCFCLQANQSPSFTLVDDASTLEILSPTLAHRKTAKLRLDNGLEAFLISDPDIQQSAAALAVEVGSWNDPEDYPGMAHFLEHMLFMGNKAYPNEFEYMQYITESGGKVNAYTASDRTVYMFSINNDRFEGALDRFSHFFIDPLFLPSCISRELYAVDQEHAKNVENDGWRQYMIFKETANQNHPCAKFSTGNAETLGGIPQEAMRTWYQQHYSANKMHLVIYSALPLDQLIDLTANGFNQVPTNGVQSKRFDAAMTGQDQEGATIYIKPVKDIKVLSITWELPLSLAQEKEAMAGELLSYLLKNGGENSLLSELKRQQLAEGIRAGEDRFSRTNVLFSLDVELTDRGVRQVHKVIASCFDALARLKKTGIPLYVYNEVKSVCDISYKYQSRDDAFAYVSASAHKMIDEPLETFPQKTLMPTHYRPEIYKEYIEHLSPNRAVFFVQADPQLSGIVPTKTEKWMGAQYAIQVIDPKLLASWSRGQFRSKIGLPSPNPYIPQSLKLVHKAPQDSPIQIVNLKNARVYYSGDHDYQVPQISHLFRIATPCLDGTARSAAFADLYCKALRDSLFPITQAAETAGSRIEIEQTGFSFTIAINGYSEPSYLLAENVFKALRRVKPTREQYQLYRQSLHSSYENGPKELPVIQSLKTVSNVLFNDSPTDEEKLSALDALTYEEFCSFTKELFQSSYMESLLYGNLKKEEAMRLSASLLSILDSKLYAVENHKKREILLLPPEKGPFMIASQTPMQGNAAVLVIQEGPYSFEKRASQDILAKVMRNEFFETLRTKQQTAYIAKAWEKEEEKQLLQLFAVQSSTHQPGDLIARFELFIEDFIKQFTTILPAERFENVRQMAITSLSIPPENLRLSAARLFSLAFDYEGDFQLVDKRIESLKKLTYEQLQQDAIEFLSRSNTRRLAILLEGAVQKGREFRYEMTSKEELRDEGVSVTKDENSFTGPKDISLLGDSQSFEKTDHHLTPHPSQEFSRLHPEQEHDQFPWS